MRLPLHHAVVLEADLVVPVAHEVLEQRGGARHVQERREDRTLGEALPQEDAPPTLSPLPRVPRAVGAQRYRAKKVKNDKARAAQFAKLAARIAQGGGGDDDWLEGSGEEEE